MAAKRKGVKRTQRRRALQRGGMKVYRGQALQRGHGGMNVYRGQALQRGHGFGGLLKGLFRIAVPVIRRTAVKAAPMIRRSLVNVGKRALKSAGKRALKIGADALKDIGKDPAVQALNQNEFKELQRLLSLSNVPINRSAPKRKANTNVRKRKSKVRRNQIIAPSL